MGGKRGEDEVEVGVDDEFFSMEAKVRSRHLFPRGAEEAIRRKRRRRELRRIAMGACARERRRHSPPRALEGARR